MHCSWAVAPLKKNALQSLLSSNEWYADWNLFLLMIVSNWISYGTHQSTFFVVLKELLMYEYVVRLLDIDLFFILIYFIVLRLSLTGQDKTSVCSRGEVKNLLCILFKNGKAPFRKTESAWRNVYNMTVLTFSR